MFGKDVNKQLQFALKSNKILHCKKRRKQQAIFPTISPSSHFRKLKNSLTIKIIEDLAKHLFRTSSQLLPIAYGSVK